MVVSLSLAKEDEQEHVRTNYLFTYFDVHIESFHVLFVCRLSQLILHQMIFRTDNLHKINLISVILVLEKRSD